jgi:hypothetical protein
MQARFRAHQRATSAHSSQLPSSEKRSSSCNSPRKIAVVIGYLDLIRLRRAFRTTRNRPIVEPGDQRPHFASPRRLNHGYTNRIGDQHIRRGL